MDSRLVAAVRARAGNRCEYCLIPAGQTLAPFHVDHVIALQHGGPTAPGNLAYACPNCNEFKGPNLASLDRVTSRTKLVRLFNPRQHRWNYHFSIDGPLVIGRTPIGRATLYLLNMNARRMVALREALIAEGAFPPGG